MRVVKEGESGFTVPHISISTLRMQHARKWGGESKKAKGREEGETELPVRVGHLLSLVMQQELTQPSWPFIRVTQAPRFRNSPVWIFHIFMFLSQELVHRKWPLKVKQQSEMVLVCALKQRWGAC